MTTFEEEFADWLSFATVTVEPFGGSGAWGDDFGAPVEIPAWYDFQERRVATADGTTVTTSTLLFASTQYLEQFAVGSKVAIPGEPQPFKVMQRRSWPGDDTHLEVTLL